MNFKKLKKFVIDNNSQSHLCICNTHLFDSTLSNGIYGFPHSGNNRKKSFWRSIASSYNIGKNDLIFLYRTNGNIIGCQEIYGPFKIHDIEDLPTVYYDFDSEDFPMKINGEIDCKTRFLFNSFEKDVYSISDNYELIKKYEFREIWGYRHPAVMNIGAARKKSISAFTNKQTLVFLDLLEKYGIKREELEDDIPSSERIEFLNEINQSEFLFKIDGHFISNNYSKDEAYLYSYFISAIKNNENVYSSDLLKDFSKINNPILEIDFKDLINIMLEVIITTHLQDELDIVLTDKEDKVLLFIEFKIGEITQDNIDQIENYLDLLNSIYPERICYANLVGSGKNSEIRISDKFSSKIRLVEYSMISKSPVKIKFEDITK